MGFTGWVGVGEDGFFIGGGGGTIGLGAGSNAFAFVRISACACAGAGAGAGAGRGFCGCVETGFLTATSGDPGNNFITACA